MLNYSQIVCKIGAYNSNSIKKNKINKKQLKITFKVITLKITSSELLVTAILGNHSHLFNHYWNTVLKDMITLRQHIMLLSNIRSLNILRLCTIKDNSLFILALIQFSYYLFSFIIVSLFLFTI